MTLRSRVRGAGRRLLGPGSYDEVEVVFRLLGGTRGTMVDVGAHHGWSHRSFAEAGWTVLAVEPDPANRAVLESTLRPHVTVDPRAIGAIDGECLTLFTSDVSSGISTLSPFHDSHQAANQVETVRLDTLLAAHGVGDVRFLKVDTEGFDLPVLQTFPWGHTKPGAVVCEFEDSKTERLGYTYRDLGDFLVAQGYTVLLSEWHPITQYGRRHDWRRVVHYPTGLEDEKGWGNFIAVEPVLARKALRLARIDAARLRVRRALGL